jgi:hypothetical protein
MHDGILGFAAKEPMSTSICGEQSDDFISTKRNSNRRCKFDHIFRRPGAVEDPRTDGVPQHLNNEEIKTIKELAGRPIHAVLHLLIILTGDSGARLALGIERYAL